MKEMFCGGNCLKKLKGMVVNFMLRLLMFLGLILSIVKANRWVIVPTGCIVFCWIVSVIGFFIYAYAMGATKTIVDEMKKQKNQEVSKT